MDKDLLKKSYTAAALAAAGITAAIVLYPAAAEILRRAGFSPPLTAPAAYAVKYLLYIVAVSVLPLLRLVGRLDVRKATPEAALRSLTLLAILRAALCECPAVCGLVLFLLTGFYADFALLLVFAAGLEIYNFPRLGAWEERLRGEFGPI